ncbi:MAG: PAS domain S-box protein [Acidobacteria bacterium]|nr:PAS domain S-box protein [Acidobacteriota bacterium]
MQKPLRILILEHAAADGQLIEHELRKSDIHYYAKRVETRDALSQEIRESAPDLILSDYSLPLFDAIAAMELAKQLAPLTPFIIVTGSPEEAAFECPKNGVAVDVIREQLARVGPAVKGLLERKRFQEEKERVEEKLRQSEEIFRRIVETAGEGIWIIDPEDKATFVNHRMAEMLGYTVDEMMGRPVFDFMDEEGRAFLRSALARRRQGIAEQYDFRFQRQDGTDLLVIVSATPFFDKDGHYAGALAMITDITDRKHAEQELAAKAEELARSNAELEQFAHIASHDLKEPLRTVASFVQLLARRYQGKLDPNADQYIALVVQGVKRMQEMIQGLLLYSQVGAPRKSGPVACEAEIGRVLANLQLAIEESGAQVVYDPLPTVVVEPQQLCHLFQNLIGNALKFHGAQPPQVRVSAKEKEKEWLFSVRDNGIGIAPQYSDRIFAIFQRLHQKEEYPGTGIGLAICKKIVEGYGGRIWVESEPGKGSVFYFTLPREAAGVAEAEAPSLQRASKRETRETKSTVS